MPKEAYIQVGICALRDPFTGDPLPAEPIYIKAPADETAPVSQTAAKLLSNGEKDLLNGIAGVLAAKHREYVNGIKRIDKINRVPAVPKPPRQTPEDELDELAATLERRSLDVIRGMLPKLPAADTDGEND